MVCLHAMPRTSLLRWTRPWNAEKIAKAPNSRARSPAASWRESHSHSPLLKTCADSILQPFPGSPGRGEGWGTYTPVSLCASERHVEPRSEEERCSQISPERSLPGAHGARRWPPAGSWHPQASSGLRAHSFRPAPPHTHFPLAVQRPLGRCFMNCVHEYVVPTAGMLFS